MKDRMTSAEFCAMQGLAPPGSDKLKTEISRIKRHENSSQRTLQNPKPEPSQVEALATSDEGKGSGTTRPIVRVTSFRCRLLDRSNLWGGWKGLEDCLVASGLIAGDSEKDADIQVTQIRVSHRFEERTEIIIEYP